MFIVNITQGNSDTFIKSFDTSEEAENYVLRKLKGTDKKTIEVFEWDNIALELSYWNQSTREQESYMLEY
ncbi:hypothetical protein LMOIWNZ_00075 [Enterococcus phage vB_OCPT_CCS3]|nr:hypothetical protein LMOIWNZ_00075 [Enterococcus phage vB_OCPT_CCS3]